MAAGRFDPRKSNPLKSDPRKPNPHNLDAPAEVQAQVVLDRVDYQDAYSLEVVDAASRSAEQWLRAVFEGAPWVVRVAIRSGWRLLGATLGPAASPDHVLGWRIGVNEPDHIRIEVVWRSGVVANLVLVRWPSSIVLSTSVEQRTRAARVLWLALIPVHRLLLRYLLWRVA